MTPTLSDDVGPSGAVRSAAACPGGTAAVAAADTVSTTGARVVAACGSCALEHTARNPPSVGMMRNKPGESADDHGAGRPARRRTVVHSARLRPSQYGSRNRLLYSLPLGSRGIASMKSMLLGRL